MNPAPLVAVSSLLLIAFALIPRGFANAHVVVFRRIVTIFAALHFVLAIFGLLAIGLTRSSDDLDSASFLNPYILYDQLSSLMLLLISFVGLIICNYSIRYLDGDLQQGGYFRWTAFTLGSVSLTVLSGNMLLFMVSWIMTSLGLHRLLLHFSERPAAQRAAWSKFTISRMGDAALCAAAFLYYDQFNTLNFSQLFESAKLLEESGSQSLHWAGVLLAFGAITKSAQIPFHSWMPLTMETPTPVSALMHAGIVNAGGYLILRTSPLVALSSSALLLLVAVGGFTAIVGALVMLTQPSIKKKLAYSTIAQMGFMLLQCGLGAYTAAMLHILAHSLYKAHAFLSSGSVVSQRTSISIGQRQINSSVVVFLLSATLVACFQLVLFWLMGASITEKQGSLLLCTVLSLGLAGWLSNLTATGRTELLLRGWIWAAGLCVVYVVSFQGLDRWLDNSQTISRHSWTTSYIALLILILFVLGSVGQLKLLESRPSRWIQALYVHASNGFYLDVLLRRWIGSIPRV